MQESSSTSLLWHLASFILPLFSLNFYRIALRKRLSQAIVFFAVFATTISALFTLKVVRIVTDLDSEIQTSLEEDRFPTIRIQDGVASVDAPQPLILLDQAGQMFVLDTSGRYTDIEPGRYREGILLTRTELIVLDRTGQRQSLQLSDLNELFNTDPIVIDEEFILQAWNRFSRVAVAFAGFGLWIWQFIVRLMVLTFVGLLIWGSVSVLRNQTDYASIMIIGLYAVVPALYLHYLLGRVGLTLPGFQTMILMLIWMSAAIATLDRGELAVREQQQRLLRMAPIAVPMLLVLAWDVVFTPDIEPLALWAVPILTFIAWFVMRSMRVDEDQPPAGLG
jgi:hypothetical protein